MIRTTTDFAKAFRAARRVSTPLIAVRTPDPASSVQLVLSTLNGACDETAALQWDAIRGLVKTMRLALTCGYRVFVCSNMAFSGDFTPVLAKHSKSLNLVDSISVGVDRMQRNFAPMQKQVESWQSMELSNVSAKMIVYEAFIESELEVPKHLARRVHDLYFEPQYEEFRPRTMWSLSNAFTSAFKELDPIPQFKATAKLGAFLEERLARKF